MDVGGGEAGWKTWGSISPHVGCRRCLALPAPSPPLREEGASGALRREWEDPTLRAEPLLGEAGPKTWP